mmetsp:Transcript_18271/g.70608  ORF Transcript_18271/g.70608 Transcript_18271/m.70608 type:complete len:342 (-) Transcript_18271:292-1317(-)
MSQPKIVVADSAAAAAAATTVDGGIQLDSGTTARIQANLGTGRKGESRVIVNEDGEKKALNQGYTPKATLYFKNNKNSMYNIDLTCTKVLIEGCHDCVITFNGRVNTEMVEIWSCTNVTLNIKVAKIKTMQVDLCEGLKLNYASKKNFNTIIWAGVRKSEVTIGDETISVDFDEMKAKEEFSDINDKTDQFYIRYVKNKLMQELVVRLDNGFPTTNREADEFDRKKEKNDKLYEEHVRKLLASKTTGIADKLEKLTKISTKRPGRNEPCTCGSGKKYKKCCIDSTDDDMDARYAANMAALKLAEEEKAAELEGVHKLAQQISDGQDAKKEEEAKEEDAKKE